MNHITREYNRARSNHHDDDNITITLNTIMELNKLWSVLKVITKTETTCTVHRVLHHNDHTKCLIFNDANMTVQCVHVHTVDVHVVQRFEKLGD